MRASRNTLDRSDDPVGLQLLLGYEPSQPEAQEARDGVPGEEGGPDEHQGQSEDAAGDEVRDLLVDVLGTGSAPPAEPDDDDADDGQHEPGQVEPMLEPFGMVRHLQRVDAGGKPIDRA